MPFFLLLINADEAAIRKSTSADQEVRDRWAPAQPDQLPDASFQLLDVDQIYLTHHNGGASIINAKKIGPDAKKTMVDGKEVIELCDDGFHKIVWEVPMAGDDCEWQCLWACLHAQCMQIMCCLLYTSPSPRD